MKSDGNSTEETITEETIYISDSSEGSASDSAGGQKKQSLEIWEDEDIYIPEDVFAIILDFLSDLDLVTVRTINKRFKELVKNYIYRENYKAKIKQLQSLLADGANGGLQLKVRSELERYKNILTTMIRYHVLIGNTGTVNFKQALKFRKSLMSNNPIYGLAQYWVVDRNEDPATRFSRYGLKEATRVEVRENFKFLSIALYCGCMSSCLSLVSLGLAVGLPISFGYPGIKAAYAVVSSGKAQNATTFGHFGLLTPGLALFDLIFGVTTEVVLSLVCLFSTIFTILSLSFGVCNLLRINETKQEKNTVANINKFFKECNREENHSEAIADDADDANAYHNSNMIMETDHNYTDESELLLQSFK